MDSKEYRRRAHEMVDFIADYYDNLEKYPGMCELNWCRD
mgnify:CR=1 FL=1